MSKGIFDIMANNRDYKIFEQGSFYHIYNRGNNKEKIFLDEQDYCAFLFRMGLALGFETKELTHTLLSTPYSRIRINGIKKDKIKLHAFSLMPNHFHFLLEQKDKDSISALIHKAITSYSKYFNKKYGRVGHVFQDQFKAVLIESNPQMMWTSAYIHMNAVKDGLVKKPDNYKWCSFGFYKTDQSLPILEKNFLLELFKNKENLLKQTFSFHVKDAL